MSESKRVPAGIDPSVPSVARMYDYYLRGKDNFASDRDAAQKIIRLVPNMREIAQDNRDFLIRVVRTLAAAGIRQFIDIGTGLPTQQNVHQVALEVAPDSRIVYIDNDPIVLVHARALLADATQTIVLEGDLCRPEEITVLPRLREHIDFDQPVAMLLFAVAHFIPDDDEVSAIVDRLRVPLVSGSYLAMSHSYAGEITEETRQVGQKVYRSTSSGSVTPRGVDQITGLFAGLELLPPGIVPIQGWRPEKSHIRGDFRKPGLLGAVGRVP